MRSKQEQLTTRVGVHNSVLYYLLSLIAKQRLLNVAIIVTSQHLYALYAQLVTLHSSGW